MCGIIGIASKSLVTKNLIIGLQHLEYRGYDSAGIAVFQDNTIKIVRSKGKIISLLAALEINPIDGNIGIGHTRWATHGLPSENNAHPHTTDKVAVVHNGIIENFRHLKEMLITKGFKFYTETDTEVIPNLITDFLNQGLSPLKATQQAVKMLQGAFAIAVMFNEDKSLLIGARKGAPLAVGYGTNEMYLGSDSYALNHLTNKVSYLEEGDLASINSDSVIVYDTLGQKVDRKITIIKNAGETASKGNFEHFMLKEIYEQPSVVAETMEAYVDASKNLFKFPDMPFNFTSIPKITIIACGTSYYAGMVAKYWFETIAHIPVEIDFASEFRYRNVCLPEGGVALFISQSGETADTLAALRFAKTHKQHILSIVNVEESSIARESDLYLQTHAGIEIGVASTKAFIAQLTTLAVLVLYAAKEKNVIKNTQLQHFISELTQIPGKIANLLNYDDRFKELAKKLVDAKSILYMGRGTSYAIALEGALKLKELSYIHAEATAAGELKHGTIALIDKNLPIVVIAPPDNLFEKTSSNVQEIAARGGQIITFSNKEGNAHFNDLSVSSFDMMECDPFVAPLLYVIPVQLLAYYTSYYKGTDIDQPRNLAKSVTVE